MEKIKLPHRHGGGGNLALLQEQLDRVDHFQRVAEVFKLLDDATRIRVFWLLCHCEECVLNISAMMGMSSPAVSHHLRALKNSGLIVSRRTGKEVYYRASATEQSRLLHQMIEQIMSITCPEREPGRTPAEYQPSQIEAVREIHDSLLRNMETRVTIEELSRKYLINPTTLKAAFKAVYGTSIAAHIKEHRMEQAAKLLRESDMSIAEVAQAVGYDSQSKFTTAFKAFFQMLPREYRANHNGQKNIPPSGQSFEG